MGIFQRGETYQHIRRFREDGSPTDVSSAIMTIEYPCESESTEVIMDRTGVGTYQGHWDIPEDAPYGEYTVTVKTISGEAVSKFLSSFLILPWNIIQPVRQLSGIKESNAINNDDLSLIVWNSYLEVREDVFHLHQNERLKTNIHNMVNGTNVRFFVEPDIVDTHLTCEDEVITGFYMDVNGCREELDVTVLNPITGEIEIRCIDGRPVGCGICDLYLTYRTHSKSFTEQLFKKAIMYHVAHEVILRFHELDKATLADMDSNKATFLANPNRMFTHYKRIRSKISVCKYAGV